MVRSNSVSFRSTHSFGIAGLLGEGCQVYFGHFFGARHVGHISDLLVANYSAFGVDSFRLRSALVDLFAFASISDIDSKRPINFEFGADSEKIAFGVSFSVKDFSQYVKVIPDLGQELKQYENEPQGTNMIRGMRFQVDHLVIRWDEKKSWVELVVFFGLPAKTPFCLEDVKDKVEIFCFDSAQAEATPAAEQYLEISDLDYFNLLRTESSTEKRHVDATSVRSVVSTDDVESSIVLPGSVDEGDDLLARISQDIDNLSDSEVSVRIRSHFDSIKDEFQSVRVRDWVGDSIQGLIREKDHISALAKKLNLIATQRSQWAREAERKVTEEIHRRDVIIRNKDAAIARLQEQLGHFSDQLERLKSIVKPQDESHAQVRRKLQMLDRMLETAKEENADLIRKVSELKKELVSARLSTHGKSNLQLELTSLRGKYDRLRKQVDEFKRVNVRLVDRLASQKTGQELSDAGVEEIKKRLETAIKFGVSQQKEAETLRQKVYQLERHIIQLRNELSRLQPKKPDSNEAA